MKATSIMLLPQEPANEGSLFMATDSLFQRLCFRGLGLRRTVVKPWSCSKLLCIAVAPKGCLPTLLQSDGQAAVMSPE